MVNGISDEEDMVATNLESMSEDLSEAGTYVLEGEFEEALEILERVAGELTTTITFLKDYHDNDGTNTPEE